MKLFKRLFITLLLISLIFCSSDSFAAYRKSKAWNNKPPLGSTINWSHPLSKGLVGAWLMNEGDGLKCYDATNRFPLEFGYNSDRQPLWSNGVKGKCLKYDGSYDYVRNTSLLIAGPKFSVVWCYKYTNNLNYGHQISSQVGGWGTFVWHSGANNTNTYCGTDIATRFDNLAGCYTLGEYVALVYTHNGTNGTIYKNGKILSSKAQTVTTGINGFTWGTDGLNASLYGELLYGMLYNRALSPSEIQSLYVSPYQFIQRPKRRIISEHGGVGMVGQVISIMEN